MQHGLRFLIFLGVVIDSSSAFSQSATSDPQSTESYIRLHYTKHEYIVPMRDGVKLMTAVFVPKETGKTYPILMKRTP